MVLLQHRRHLTSPLLEPLDTEKRDELAKFSKLRIPPTGCQLIHVHVQRPARPVQVLLSRKARTLRGRAASEAVPENTTLARFHERVRHQSAVHSSGNKALGDSGMESSARKREEADQMEKVKVRELMVPSASFPKISDRATLYETLLALESAQEKFLAGKAEQRILLVEDDKGRVAGKISPLDLLRGLETNYARMQPEEAVSQFGFDYIWKSMRSDLHLWEDPFRDLCRKADTIRVRDFTRIPDKGHLVTQDDRLAKCFHLFVMTRHDSLFVVENDEIIGMLRFSDVYRLASRTIRECGCRTGQS